MRTFPVVAFVVTLVTAPLKAQVVHDDTVMTRDGIILDATITIPSGTLPPGGFPGVVLVHGYGGSKSNMRVLASALATREYASLAYSVRGQGNSGGLSTTGGEAERLDLNEVVQHFRTYPGVDPDRIAVAGGSQGGIHAWMAAVFQMAGVKTVLPTMATPHFAPDLAPANCFKQALAWELTLDAVRYAPVRDHVRDLIIRDEYDSVLTYTNERDLESLLDSVQIPVFQGLGWRDGLFPLNAGIRAAANLSARGIPIWSYYGTNGHLEPLNLDEYLYLVELSLAWLDRWLKDIPLDQAEVPMVFYADDRPGWPHHVSPTWPPDQAGTLRLYLRGGSLATAVPGVSDTVRFSVQYDSSYTPTQGWSDRYIGPRFRGAFASSPARLLSAPFLDTADVTGIPHAYLLASSDAQQFQLHARLFDVFQADTGFVWQLMTRGTLGVRGNAPGTRISAEMECSALSHRIPPGHMLGVEITSLDVDASGDAHIIPYFLSASSEVYSSPSDPSYIDIPLVGGTTMTRVQEPVAALPTEFILDQNYPNPFNASTTIGFELPLPADVRLCVYDMLGREVAVLVNETRDAGIHKVTFDASRFSSGTYFYRIQAGGVGQTKRLVLLK